MPDNSIKKYLDYEGLEYFLSKADGRYQPKGNYLTQESDTLATVTGRGGTTSSNLTLNGTINVSAGTLKLKTIQAPTSSGGETYSTGTAGNVLKSNGTSVYWASDTNSNYYPSRSYSTGLQISTSEGVSNTCALYVPYASSNQVGVISTGNQEFTGKKTFNGDIILLQNNPSWLWFKGEGASVSQPDWIYRGEDIIIDYGTGNYALSFPKESGTLATQEWVQQQIQAAITAALNTPV